MTTTDIECSSDSRSFGISLRGHLDAADTAILNELQNDARLTNVALAERIGMTAAPCLRRIRRLEDRGYIRGYHAKLDPRKLGFQVVSFVMVGLESQSVRDIHAFERQVRDWPMVRECHAVNGVGDFLLKCVARDLGEFQHFMTEMLMRTPNIKTARSSFVIRTGKEELGTPLPGIERSPGLSKND